MPSIRAATNHDAAAIVSFLTHNLSDNPERHRRMVGCQWEDPPPNIGFVVEEEGRIVGYLGGLYGRRCIAGVERHFCNMTSWTVLPKYRAFSIGLLKAMLAQPRLTITNYSASETVRKILSAFRFQPLDSGCIHILGISLLTSWFSTPRWDVVVGSDVVGELRDSDQSRLVAEHMKWSCVPVLLRQGGSHRLLLLQTHAKGFRKVSEVLYCSDWSDPEIWQPTVAMIAWRECGASWISIDARRAMRAGFSKLQMKPAFFHSNDGVVPEHIDRLFTEMVPRYGERK